MTDEKLETVWSHENPVLDADHNPYPTLMRAVPKRCTICGEVIVSKLLPNEQEEPNA